MIADDGKKHNGTQTVVIVVDAAYLLLNWMPVEPPKSCEYLTAEDENGDNQKIYSHLY